MRKNIIGDDELSTMIGVRNDRLEIRKVSRDLIRGVKHIVYVCACDCGNFITVLKGNFLRTKSCGCYRKEHLLSVRAEGKSWKNRKKDEETS